MFYYKNRYFIHSIFYLFINLCMYSISVKASDINQYTNHTLTAPLIFQDKVYSSMVRNYGPNEFILDRFNLISQSTRNGSASELSCDLSFDDETSFEKNQGDMRNDYSVDLSAQNPSFSHIYLKKEEHIQYSSSPNIPSQPVVVEYAYGFRRQRYILLSTNHGILYLYRQDQDTLSKIWTFYEPTFLASTRQVDTTVFSFVPVITISFDDKNKNGVVDRDLNESALGVVSFKYSDTSYAIDFSDPENPVLKWVADKLHEPALSRLGYAKSSPVITSLKLEGYNDPVPVVILSGGVGNSIPEADVGDGKGIYILNALTGTLIFSFSPDPDSLTNRSTPFQHAIAANVAVLDSDGNGSTDRIYVGDIGGSVWRIDLADSVQNSKVTKLAQLAGSFYSAPILVRSWIKKEVNREVDTIVPVDWVLLANNLSEVMLSEHVGTTMNYYALQDLNTESLIQSSEKPYQILEQDLYQLSSLQEQKLPENKLGWFIATDPQRKEQFFSSGYVINGQVYMTSFIPSNTSDSIGMTKLHTIELNTGIISSKPKEYLDVILDKPGLFFDVNQEQLWLTGVGDRINQSRCAPRLMLMPNVLKPRLVAEFSPD